MLKWLSGTGGGENWGLTSSGMKFYRVVKYFGIDELMVTQPYDCAKSHQNAHINMAIDIVSII